MIRTKVKTFQHRIGKNHFLVVKIFQKTSAATKEGNAIATNALNIRIKKTNKRRHK